MRAWIQHRGQWDGLAIATFVLLALCLLIGGASHQHALRVSLLELAALPVLGLALLRAWDAASWTRHRLALSVLAAAAALPLIQLIPLPPGLWSALPGREQATLGLEVAGIAPGWAPLSLTPDLTWRAFLAFLPPAAVFLGALHLGRDGRRGLAWLVLILALAGVGLGMVQIAVGDPAYPWSQTGRGTVAGFFANRNHLATLCLVALPFCAALAGAGARRGAEGRGAVWAAGFAAAVLVIALAAIRSRAGIVLAGPTLALSGLLVWTAAGRGRPGPALLGLLGGAGAALALVAAIGLSPILQRFDPDAAPEGRFDRWPTVAEAAQAHLPTGAGFGAFDRVYRSVEPLEEVDETYFNRAHNDWLESWLEGGWLSAAVALAFLAWFGRRGWTAWREPAGTDADLRRAASVGVLVILVHSAADYPLRTIAMAAVLALCCALLERAGEETTRRRAEA